MNELVRESQAMRHATEAIREQILERLSTLAWDGTTYKHPIPDLDLYRVVEPLGPASLVYEPSVSLIIKGSKQMHVGGETLVYDESSFFLIAVGLPLTGQVCAASCDKPYVAARLRLDLEKARRIIADHDLAMPDVPQHALGVAVGTATPELFDALLRLISLAHAPGDLSFLADHIHNEILYRLLRSDQGGQLRRVALAGSNGHRVARAIAWLRDNYAQPLRMEELAGKANMGVSTLHHHFRAMTAMSPLQFQKHLRLYNAREMMLAQSVDASTAALRVGYESPTQFSREYRRMFGHPPLRDIKSILNSNEIPRRNVGG